jgi:hypothetical protein
MSERSAAEPGVPAERRASHGDGPERTDESGER